MHLLSHALRVCYFTALLKLLHGYVLFAANIEDFQQLAKKLVPEHIAHSLSRVDSNPSSSEREDEGTKSEDSYETEEVNQPDNYKMGKVKPKKRKIRLNDETTVDFEELVERVKKRLQEELKNKLNRDFIKNENFKNNTEHLNNTQEISNSDDKSEYIDEITDRPTKYVSVTYKTTAERHDDYADALAPYNKKKRNIKHKPKIEKNYNNFDKVELAKKDSYEDYQAPEKDNNIYDTKENKRFKIKHNVNNNNKRNKIKNKINENVEARTEDISFDDTELGAGDTKRLIKVKPGTIIPKRERYSIVTPNYVSHQPGEKYDFDEPLPERDRERENLRYIGNPPATINKKVRLN